MAKMLEKIKANNAPLNEDDQNKINRLLKTYQNGTIKFHFSYSGLHDNHTDIRTLKEMEVLLISDTVDDLKKLEKEFDLNIKGSIGNKVGILSSEIID